MTEELEKEAMEYASMHSRQYSHNDGKGLVSSYSEVYNAYYQSAEPREKRIEELDKENGKLEGKLVDLQSEYIELENFKNNEVDGLKTQLTKAKELLLELYDCIPSSMADGCKETLQKVALFFKDNVE